MKIAKSSSPKDTGPKRVAIILESMVAPRRLMLNGVARYMQEHEPWLIYLKPTYAERSLHRWIERWDGDGIITIIHGEKHGALSDVEIPIVDLLGEFPARGFPLVRSNDRNIGKTAAEHLLERGFQHFGFFGFGYQFWSRHRLEGFRERLKVAGFECQTHDSPAQGKGSGGPEVWERHQKQLMRWIDRLPKPVGIMTANDVLGQRILEASLRLKVPVPDAVAVVGVDNDEPICRISSPPLSSVIIDDQQRGYEAASLLARLMDGHPKPVDPLLLDPLGVAARASTDVFAIDDELLVNTLRYLREVAFSNIGVEDIAGKFNVSRSHLERKFRRLLGRSIIDEIVRLRLNRAIELLTDTKLELKFIATRCGFSSQAYMTTVFHEKLGRTPGSYRR